MTAQAIDQLVAELWLETQYRILTDEELTHLHCALGNLQTVIARQLKAEEEEAA